MIRSCARMLAHVVFDFTSILMLYLFLASLMPNRIPSFKPAWTKSPAETKRAYETTADRRASIAFYQSPAWLKLRRAFLGMNPTCAECKRQGQLALATHVHHVKERLDYPELALEWNNLEALCCSCHSRLHARQKRT